MQLHRRWCLLSLSAGPRQCVIFNGIKNRHYHYYILPFKTITLLFKVTFLFNRFTFLGYSVDMTWLALSFHFRYICVNSSPFPLFQIPSPFPPPHSNTRPATMGWFGYLDFYLSNMNESRRALTPQRLPLLYLSDFRIKSMCRGLFEGKRSSFSRGF